MAIGDYFTRPKLLQFFIRLAIVGSLIKSSLEIVLINEDTPTLIIDRLFYHLNAASKYVFLDQQPILTFVMQNQTYISRIYGLMLLRMSGIVLFNYKFAVKILIGLLIFSLWFFYTDYESCCGLNVNPHSVQECLQIIVIICGLQLIQGFNDVPSLVTPKVSEEKVTLKAEDEFPTKHAKQQNKQQVVNKQKVKESADNQNIKKKKK
eukprot:403360810